MFIMSSFCMLKSGSYQIHAVKPVKMGPRSKQGISFPILSAHFTGPPPNLPDSHSFSILSIHHMMVLSLMIVSFCLWEKEIFYLLYFTSKRMIQKTCPVASD